jgi:hypothetical protein
MSRIAFLALFLFSLTAQAARFDVSSTVYPAGTRDLNVANIVTTETQITAEFTRESWPFTGGEMLRAYVYVSVNGGPYELYCGFGTDGGDVYNRDGSLSLKSTVNCSLPVGITRLINIRMTNTVPISTAIALIVN